ncbi:hypothetical protein CPC08DRAFT_709094 [Agrocybe pediades]|nr:hypothetical protein CPC08DRAFT_709094 [Agrocybe pediades]
MRAMRENGCTHACTLPRVFLFAPTTALPELEGFQPEPGAVKETIRLRATIPDFISLQCVMPSSHSEEVRAFASRPFLSMVVGRVG